MCEEAFPFTLDFCPEFLTLNTPHQQETLDVKAFSQAVRGYLFTHNHVQKKPQLKVSGNKRNQN